MKKLLTFTLLLLCFACQAQNLYEPSTQEPESTIQIAVSEIDSILIFTFSDTAGVKHTVPAYAGYFRAGDFINLCLDSTWNTQVAYYITGTPTFRSVQKEQK